MSQRFNPNVILERQSLLQKGEFLSFGHSRIRNIMMKTHAENRDVVGDQAFVSAIKEISSSTANTKYYFSECITLLENVLDKNKESCVNTICDKMIPRLNKDSFEKLTQTINDSNLNDTIKNKLICKIEETRVFDRIASNYKKLNKRFTIDKMIEECVELSRSKNYNDIVNETISSIYSLIDTYDMPSFAKYNIAIEAIQYGFFLKSHTTPKDNIYTITETFLLSNPVITDKVRDRVIEICEENVFVDNETRDNIKSILEYKSSTYKNKVDKLAAKCKDSDNADFVRKVKTVRTENEASEYINVACNRINLINMPDTDRSCIIKAIFLIPLIGNVSASFVKYEYKRKIKKKDTINKIEDKLFVDTINDLVKDEILELEEMSEEELNLIKFADFICESIEDPDDFFSDYYKEKSIEDCLLESEDFADSADIKKVIDRFNADQKKDLGRFKNMLNKIYAKSPSSIIDSTPKIFTIIRAGFIVGTILIPTVGPVIALVAAFVDKMLSMHLNVKQSEKFIKALDKEKEKAKKDLEKKKSANKKKELESYIKCLDKCIEKVEDYRSTFTDDDIEGRKTDIDSSDDFGDLGFDDNDDFSLENYCINFSSYADKLTEILEFSQNNTLDSIIELSKNLTSPEQTLFVEITHRCPIIIDFSEVKAVAESANRYKINYNVFAKSDNNKPCYNKDYVKDVLFEHYMLNEFKQVIVSEDALNTLKLAIQNGKKKAKDLSAKEKSMWQTVDAHASGFINSAERAMTSNRREGIIKGSVIPSFSKCFKLALVLGGTAAVNPILGLIATLGYIGVSKKLNQKEKQLIYDEIDTELKVVDKQIQLAEADGDMKQYRFYLQVQRRLEREKSRIKYGVKAKGRNIP